MYYNDTLTFINVLNQLVYNDNNTIHSTTKVKPVDIMHGIKRSKQIYKSIPENVFEIGDKVRHLKKVRTFTKKAFKNPYSVKVYEIIDILNNKYVLSNNKTYEYFELIKTNDTQNDTNDTQNDTNNTFSKQVKQLENKNKEIQTNQQDFKMKQNEIDAQIY
jgi:hypothetical protein